MSRPNGPVRHPGMPAQSEFQNDPHAVQGGEVNPNQYAQQQQPGYTQQGGHAPQQHPTAPTDQTAYGQSYATPTYTDPAQPAAQSQPHTEQPVQGYDPSATSTAWADANQSTQYGTPPAQGYADPTAYGQAPAQPQAASYSAEQPAYDQALTQPQAHATPSYPQSAGAPVHPTTPSVAPTGYDFASYDAPQPAQQFDAGLQTRQDTDVDWGQAGFNPTTSVAGAPAANTGDLGFGAQPAGMDPSQQPVHVDEAYTGEDEDYEYEDEDDGSGGRGFLVAAALAGAILIGGGVAYGYQTIFGGPSTDKPPVVKGATGPAKVKPADPGGRKFAHTDSKIMGRLGSASGMTNDPASGARRVSTLRIGRDGSVVAPTKPAAAAGAGAQRMVTGMTLGGDPSSTAATAKPVATAPANKPIVVKPPAVKTPVKTATVTPAAPKVTAPKALPQPTKTAPVAAPKAAPKPAPTNVAVAKPAPVSTGPKPTGAGYVAVLASVPVSKSSRMDALKQFADMQQKYGTALQNKTPDVQRADLGAKGTYHRLIAGPPGSAQSARAVCNSLKTAGYSSCWVLAY